MPLAFHKIIFSNKLWLFILISIQSKKFMQSFIGIRYLLCFSHELKTYYFHIYKIHENSANLIN